MEAARLKREIEQEERRLQALLGAIGLTSGTPLIQVGHRRLHAPHAQISPIQLDHGRAVDQPAALLASPIRSAWPAAQPWRWIRRAGGFGRVLLDRGCARLADVFDDGEALFDAVVSYGLEGIVAKRRAGLYRSGYRGWTKVKNPAYWRRESEIEAMRRRREVERLNPARV